MSKKISSKISSKTKMGLGMAASALMAVAVAAGSVQAQQVPVTIGDLARDQVEQQRENLRVAAAKRALSSASAAKSIQDSREQVRSLTGGSVGARAAAAAQTQVMQAKPKWMVHALYAQGNVWVAEMTYGQKLIKVTPGTRVGDRVATKVDSRGVYFGSRLVTLGRAM